jgi:hypothetical protein
MQRSLGVPEPQWAGELTACDIATNPFSQGVRRRSSCQSMHQVISGIGTDNAEKLNLAFLRQAPKVHRPRQLKYVNISISPQMVGLRRKAAARTDSNRTLSRLTARRTGKILIAFAGKCVSKQATAEFLKLRLWLRQLQKLKHNFSPVLHPLAFTC